MTTWYLRGASGAVGSGTFYGIWAATQNYAVGDRVAPTRAYATAASRGYMYECTSDAGSSGASEPSWVATPGSTTTDSGITWTCREMDDWTDAGVYLDQVIQRAPADNESVLIHYTLQDEIAGDVTYTITGDNVSIFSVDKDNSDALRPMGTDGWIGNSTTNRGITLGPQAGEALFVYGLTFRTAGSTADTIGLNRAVEESMTTAESCYFWNGNTAGTANISFMYPGSGSKSFTRLHNCIFRFGNVGQSIAFSGTIEIIGGLISADGSAITDIFECSDYSHRLYCAGFDLSAAAASADLVLAGSAGVPGFEAVFHQCKLPSSFGLLDTSWGNEQSGQVLVTDSHSGDEHYHIAHENPLGTTVISSTIYADDNICDTALSWKIDTNTQASFYHPYRSPTIEAYNSNVSTSITPRLEVLRNGSTTAYQNDEIWGEFYYKDTTGYSLGTVANDRMTLLGSPANQDTGVGTTGWHDTSVPGNPATAWSGKLEISTFTANEVGHVVGRVCVGEPSITVYVDPQIRGI